MSARRTAVLLAVLAASIVAGVGPADAGPPPKGPTCAGVTATVQLSLGQAPPLDRKAGADSWQLPPPDDEMLQRFYERTETAVPADDRGQRRNRRRRPS